MFLIDNINLTKDSDFLICAIYKKYLENRKKGISKLDCKRVGTPHKVQKEIISKWSIADIDETCRELDRAGLLACSYGDNLILRSYLTDHAIIYMENRFKKGLNEISDFISKFIP